MSYEPRRPRRKRRARGEGRGILGKQSPDQCARGPENETDRKARAADRKAQRLEDRIEGRRR